MNSALHYPAPAKLNLNLRILGRRADGYHLLESLFCLVDFADSISIRVREDGKLVRLQSIANVAEADDLSMRAARLLQASSGCRLGAEIAVSKRIPQGAGLGGGSSDAATVLMVLNHLWGTGLDRAALKALGLQLGADVPFFIHGQSARARGIGETLESVTVAPAWYLILHPPVHAATAAVFAALGLTPGEILGKIAVFQNDGFSNDLEAAAVQKYPEIGECLAWLRQYAPACMTGSGSSVFASFATLAEAQDILAKVPPGLPATLAQGLDRHPLYGLLE